MKVPREKFERHFAQVQASWAYEGYELSLNAKEQIRRVCMGEISKAEFDKWVREVGVLE